MGLFGGKKKRQARRAKRKERRAERRKNGKGLRGALKRFGGWIGENKGKILKGAVMIAGTALGGAGGVVAGGLIGKIGGFATKALGKLKGKGVLGKIIGKISQKGGKMSIPAIKETVKSMGIQLPQAEEGGLLAAVSAEYQKATGKQPQMLQAAPEEIPDVPQEQQHAVSREYQEEIKPKGMQGIIDKLKEHWKIVAGVAAAGIGAIVFIKMRKPKGRRR